MKQLKIIQHRLKKPSVIVSLVSQIAGIILLISHNENLNTITKIVVLLFSILVTLGILSNPDSQKSGYGDDIKVCPSCDKECNCVLVNGEFICSECGCPCCKKEKE